MNKKHLMDLILNILKTVPLFQSLTEAQHQSIIDHITMQYYPAHYALFKEGDTGDAMYIIKSGMVKIHKDGQELANLGEGDFFGEMALIEEQTRNAGAETLSDCEVFVLKRWDFSQLLQSSPDIAASVQSAYQARKQANQ